MKLVDGKVPRECGLWREREKVVAVVEADICSRKETARIQKQAKLALHSPRVNILATS